MKIYLDNAASMPVSEKVLKEIKPFFNEKYGNPSSLHSLGNEAKKAIFNSRKEIAMELGVRTEEIIFTSGATEANALAIMGVAESSEKRKIIISSIEHSSVYENALLLKDKGYQIVEINVDEKEGLNLDQLEKEIDKDTAIVSIMLVNSETGIINDINKVGRICKQKNVLFHVDAVQGFGKIKVQPKSSGVDLMTASGHKIGGLKGVGFLYVREGVKIKPIYSGGQQERGFRPGTENVPAIVSFACALKEYKKTDWKEVKKNKDLLENELKKIGARISAENLPRVDTHLHVCFKNVKGEDITNYLSTKEIYCSTGSACDSEKKEKRVLEALRIPLDYRNGALRFSLSKSTTKKDIIKVVKEIKSFL